MKVILEKVAPKVLLTVKTFKENEAKMDADKKSTNQNKVYTLIESQLNLILRILCGVIHSLGPECMEYFTKLNNFFDNLSSCLTMRSSLIRMSASKCFYVFIYDNI